jgi:predicted enzyme related to lactoylglutathione lyase
MYNFAFRSSGVKKELNVGNAVTQFQIISNNPESSSAFYAELFGWNIDAVNPMGYRRIETGSVNGIQGGIWPAPTQVSTFSQLFVTVEDVKASAQIAERLGARLVIPPTVLPEGDEFAVLHDPQGMPFAIVRAAQKT